jgi:N-acetylglucosaminyl-diphospho-decaprenol L-rhamnosyltransferase
MTDLGIVIVSWNVRDLLAVCLDSVLNSLTTDHCAPATEIVVVDNASTDGSAEMARSRFPQVRLIVSEKNLGFAGGNNLGMRAWGLDVERRTKSEEQAKGVAPHSSLLAPRYVLLLNPDTVVRGDALATMVRFMDANPQVGLCGARLVYGDGSFQHSAFGFPGLWQIALDSPGVHPRLLDSRLNGRYSRKLYAAGQPFEIDHPLGAAMLARAEAIHQVGLMDEGFHMYCEEVDWCWRIKKAGWKIYCAPQAEIVHYAGQSTRQVRAGMIVALWTSRRRLYHKHYPVWKLAAARWLVRRKMRGELQRADAALAHGELDKSTHTALVAAYRRVIELYTAFDHPL